jgi:hypothetical protein
MVAQWLTRVDGFRADSHVVTVDHQAQSSTRQPVCASSVMEKQSNAREGKSMSIPISMSMFTSFTHLQHNPHPWA